MDAQTSKSLRTSVWGGVAFSVSAAAAVWFLARSTQLSAWANAFGVATLASVLCLVLFQFFKNQSKKIRTIENLQFARMNQAAEIKGATVHGIAFANQRGFGVTYFPTYEIFIDWNEITGYILFQKDIETYTKSFVEGWTKPPTRPGSAHTLLLTTTRQEMPVVAIEIPKSDLETWSDIVDLGKTDPEKLTTSEKKPLSLRNYADQTWRSGLIIIIGVVLTAFWLILTLKPNPIDVINFAHMWFTLVLWLQLYSPPRYQPYLADPSLLRTLLVANGQISDEARMIALLAGAIWLCRPGEVLRRIPVAGLSKVAVNPVKHRTTANVKVIFTEGDGHETESFVNAEHLDETLVALLAERPELKILGADNLVLQPSH